jgi:hypothetical protein
MRRLMMHLVVWTTAACVRGAEGPADAGQLQVAVDAGFPLPPVCDPSAEPASGALVSTPGVAATIDPQQQQGWTIVSTDGECASITPPPIPARRFWVSPDAKEWCDPVVIDGSRDVAVPRLAAPLGAFTSLLPADGSEGATIASGAESVGGLVGAGFGFWAGVASHTNCYYREALTGNGTPINRPIAIEPDGRGTGLSENFLGGYIQSALKTAPEDLSSGELLASLQVRWVDNDLHPLDDWITALDGLKEGAYNGDGSVFVDPMGRALVLGMSAPKGFGPPPPLSSFIVEARWLDSSGKLGPPFTPVLPAFYFSGHPITGASWGTLLPLPDGGFAAYEENISLFPGADTEPSGWYAFYPSGEPRVTRPPAWLEGYDGSIRLLHGGQAFGATRRDVATCARTVELVGASGKLCATLQLEGSDLCSKNDVIAPDGTLVLEKQDGCDVRWWPGLLALTQPASSSR